MSNGNKAGPQKVTSWHRRHRRRRRRHRHRHRRRRRRRSVTNLFHFLVTSF